MAAIAVVIVNYNTAEMALSAVESVLSRQHGGRKVHVHLVDNASPNGDADWLESAIGQRGWRSLVTLYRELANGGFGRGNNRVLKELSAESNPSQYVFFLNPDSQLENEAIALLADFMDAQPRVSMAGTAIRKPDGHAVVSAFRFPGILSTFASALSFGPVTRALNRWQVPLPPGISTRRVDWVAGAAMMGRLSDLRGAGFFDPEYFLYFEEVDLMKKIARSGGEVWHLAEARVIHEEGGATRVKGESRNRRPAYWYESWRYYFVKNHGRTKAIAVAAAWYLGAFGNDVLRLLFRRETSLPDHFYVDLWGIGIRPLLGLEARRYG